ncbi:MAG: tryptophan--tRNA ligase [Saprospiraceae bacterium]|nr:tryptophan--tRNA ligase [Candidatus Vicinibacter affinis]MBP6173892.1 tryptophan--tRNA ligase [Saprospiraceae bacterium]MBK6573237.1 tryptophan--tRNA ligase [Candidatus Vicinibacter affinis]MBK6822293.1 tryptophan--tRNA ligase [Candidatus Vicinibacter affinis]MBK7301920.1 tryptophan--tRNA ligase [Candidatus Vicinibacter affinis]
MSQKIILSGIQPTGNLHLGRYFGAVQNWVNLQEDYNCVYGIVDYHAMTMPYNPAKLRENVWELTINLLACGIKPENLFIQSMIPEHAELGWILGCMCSYGELSRMVQFKDKSEQVKEKDKDMFISSGLFTYPVLQAADILIYKADYVPVGKDQDQHLELTRNIAQRFNNVVGKDYFVMPEPMYTEIPKVMSTADPLKKMSASAGDKHNINVFASEDQIRKQIRSAVTDAGNDPTKMAPGTENLFSILIACGRKDSYDELLSSFKSGNLKYSILKDTVADAIIDLVKPIQARREIILQDKKAVKDQIKKSSAEIRLRAAETLKEVKNLCGLS